MKYFIVADVHGFYNELERALKDAGFDKDNHEHIFVSLGDLLDRGNFPLQCLKFVNSLDRKILIRGNHEDLMEEALARREFRYHDYTNGTAGTAFDLSGYGVDCFSEDEVIDRVKSNEEYNKYLSSTVDYYDDGENVFVHGWIPCETSDDNMCHSRGIKYHSIDSWESGSWRRARWINGMDAWNNGVRLDGKTIYCGHWHTSWGHSKIHKIGTEWDNEYSTNPDHRKAHFEPFVDNGIVALDACTAYSHKINCYVKEIV